MKVAALVLYAVGLVGELFGFTLLVKEVRDVRSALGEDHRFVIDGGDAFGETEGPHLGTTLTVFGHAMTKTNLALATIALGILAGSAGNFVALG